MDEAATLLSIVIPVYNEEANVDILHEEIRNSIDQLKKPYEMIFINGGNSNSTFECLKNTKNRRI